MPKKTADKPDTEKRQVKKASKKKNETEPKSAKKAARPAAVAEPEAKAPKKAVEGAGVKAAKKAGDEPKAKAPKKGAAAEKPKSAKSTGKQKKSAKAPEQIEEHIRIAAYYRWEERGRTEGLHEDDWLEAEKKIKR
jgi:hypothetical protein